MNIFKSMQKDFLRFIGKKEFIPGRYIPSKYNYCFLYSGNVPLVINTFSGVAAELSSDEYIALKQSEQYYDSSAPDYIIDLIRERFLVLDSGDELNDYLQLYEIVNSFQMDDAVTSYTVLTTTGCNARCFYCFEADFKSSTMTSRTAEAVAEYMIRASKGKPISVHWFGGEPLCNTYAIDIICKKLIASGISFRSSMTSNGYAFTHEIIKSAKAWNLEYVQVTFDGLREEHNRRKNFITNDPDPFLHTISNIHCLLEAGVGVSIRLNFDTDNLFQIRDLVDYLANEFKNEKRISFYPVALFEDCSSWRPGRDADEQIRLISEQALLRDYIKNKFRLSQKNVGKGFSMHYCGANSISHRTINPNGTFSVCHNVSDKVIYGSIFDGITDHELYKKWTNNGQPREKCRNCVWLPDCTTFSLCPVKKSYCSIDRESFVKESIIRAYQQWKHR